jgi:PAS domain S-box-containing protein
VLGVLFVEILVQVGLRPLGPLGWPALGVIVGTALWGASGALGGAAVLFAYYLWNLAEPQRFPHFFSSEESIVFWALGLAILTSLAALFRQRLIAAEAKALEAARTQAELETVRQYDERLRSITDNVPVLIGYIDTEARFRFNNLAYESWYARPRSEITGRPVREVVGEAAWQRIKPHLDRALAGGRVSFQLEYAVNGEPRHAQTTYLPDFDRAGRVKGVFVAAKDIGPQVAAQQELAAANARAEAARRSATAIAVLSIRIEGAPDAAALADAAERLRGCLRATDPLARAGENAFTAVIAGLKDRADASQVAEKMIGVMRGRGLSASVEVAFPADASSPG